VEEGIGEGVGVGVVITDGVGDGVGEGVVVVDSASAGVGARIGEGVGTASTSELLHTAAYFVVSNPVAESPSGLKYN
jgi:hypothetical protein